MPGPEAVFNFEQGLSERVGTAIAGGSDDDLHVVAAQAKRVDAELNLHTSSPVDISAPAKGASSAGSAPKRGVVAAALGAFEKARTGPSTSGGAPQWLIDLQGQEALHQVQ